MNPIPKIELRPGYTISRIIRGGWQLAGGHGLIERAQAIDDLEAFCEAGIFTFDCADIYTGVEEMIGEFRQRHANRHGAEALKKIRVQTKLVPDLEALPRLDRSYVNAIVDQSLRRLKMDCLDLVQFHWWDYDVSGYLDALGWLDDLRREGKLLNIGATNFDTDHMLEIIGAGIPLVSMQVQYSLIDARPQKRMAEAAAQNNVWLFCYGSVAGGFISDKWLGQPEPRAPLENRSLTKYKLIIDDFGGWGLFQELLQVLRAIADNHDVDIATVASRAMLDRQAVAAVIIGARNSAHLGNNIKIGSFDITPDEKRAIDAVLARSQVPEGDVYTLERDRAGRHGSIIKYNLNKAS